MGIKDYLWGMDTFEIHGADLPLCLNRLNEKGIALRNIENQEPLCMRFQGRRKWEKDIRNICEKTYCTMVVIQKQGFIEDIKKWIYRPVLCISVLCAIVASLLLENFIWKINILVEDKTIEEEILHVLQDHGIGIWSKSQEVDPHELKFLLLNQVPQLSWVAVNPQGGRLTVLAAIRDKNEQDTSLGGCHIVSAKNGVITEAVVSEGMALAKVGDSVKEGQVLISGIEDYGLYLKTVQAEGEIYGQTWYAGTVVTPSKSWEKRYTGRSWHEYSILFGRKRINLSGSSSILGVSCDKIIDTKQIRLPDHPFPLYIQRITYREYTTEERILPMAFSQELMLHRWEYSLLSSMIAGRVEQTKSDCLEKGGLYIMQGESICHELLSRSLPLVPPEKGADS